MFGTQRSLSTVFKFMKLSLLGYAELQKIRHRTSNSFHEAYVTSSSHYDMGAVPVHCNFTLHYFLFPTPCCFTFLQDLSVMHLLSGKMLPRVT